MTDVERQIAETIERVTAAFARAGAPADAEDIAQQGWLVALEALAGFDPGRGQLPPYLQAVLRPTLGKTIARWADPCTLSDYRARRGGPVERVDVDDLTTDASPEMLLAEAESRARMAAALAEVLADMGKRAAELVALDPEATSAEVAKRAGVADTRVRFVRRQFRARVERSEELRELAREAA